MSTSLQVSLKLTGEKGSCPPCHWNAMDLLFTGAIFCDAIALWYGWSPQNVIDLIILNTPSAVQMKHSLPSATITSN